MGSHFSHSPPPSLYLLVRQLPRASRTARLAKFSEAINSKPVRCLVSSDCIISASSGSKSLKNGDDEDDPPIRSVDTMARDASCRLAGDPKLRILCRMNASVDEVQVDKTNATESDENRIVSNFSGLFESGSR